MKKLWLKVANDLSLQVSLGKWPVGSVIPGEIELAKHYQVSRDTVRKALNALTKEGLFERRPHIGTRVKSKNRVGRFLHELDDIRSIDRYGNKFPRKIQNVEKIQVDEFNAERFGIPCGTIMLKFENIRIASNKIEEPVVVTFVYIFPEALGILDLAKDHPDELIINLVEDCCNTECTEVKQTFSATTMTEKISRYFNMPEGSSALRIVRNYLDAKGKNLVVSESYHPADRFSFSVSVKKKQRYWI
ncbi:MAG: GntR family transcriptional regulator [Burkholderiaceae bacterium]|nr:GntR family transcriptional regulator [Burkholderiaceae bacterium]